MWINTIAAYFNRVLPVSIRLGLKEKSLCRSIMAIMEILAKSIRDYNKMKESLKEL